MCRYALFLLARSHFLTTVTLNFFVGLSFFPLQVLLVILWSSFHFKLTNMNLSYCFICTYPSSMKLYSINFTKILIICNLHMIIFVSKHTQWTCILTCTSCHSETVYVLVNGCCDKKQYKADVQMCTWLSTMVNHHSSNLYHTCYFSTTQ